MAYDQFLDNIQEQLDQLVVTGNDDELFAGGYLQGHVMLSAGQYELEGDERCVDTLKGRVRQSLDGAIANGELNPQDQQLVVGLWERLSQ
ncbi:YfcL family protein [Gallaecimonas kandeliae]|uniref:YfcL family protein n=1 Tax=Gallaecimonas kandeliae TaxID=3029055 RepID=UPI002649D5BE|nr:YfcL family protein [Gallaecimonas kandeliae]WKE64167.1 YfcL family protein [Gallaecimonas kandeliae]